MKRLFVVVFAMVSSQFCFSQKYDPAYFQKQLQQYLDVLVHDDQSIYNSVLLVETPSFTYKIASGYADPENRIAMHVDDQFFGASTTKMMIATIVMMLEEERKIHLDDPITKYLEDSLVSGLHTLNGVSYESKITIRHLLTHRSGLNSHWSEEFINLMIQDPMRFWHPHDVIQYVKENRPSQFIPGEGWSYSDLGYILLGLIIEKVTGMDLVDASRQLLFDSLHLNHTYWQFREKERPSIPGRGPSHCFREDMDYTFWRALSADWAGGGLRTTCEDLHKFMDAFFNNQIFKDKKTRDKMYDWVTVSEEEKLYYGYGIIRFVLDENVDPVFVKKDEMIGHQGASGSFMYHFMNRDMTIVGTINQMQEDKIWDVILNVIKIFENDS